MRRYLLFLFFLAAMATAKAQQVPAFVYYNNLSKQTEFPKNLQSARSVVVLNVDEDKLKFAKKIHNKLRLMSIDAVQYIDYNDLTAGTDAPTPILAYYEKRIVKYVNTF